MAQTLVIPSFVTATIDTAITPAVAGATFMFQPDSTGGDFSGMFVATGTLTTLSADLQVSYNQGTTWTTVLAAAIVAATPVKIFTPVIANVWYRWNYTAGTGPVTMQVSTN